MKQMSEQESLLKGLVNLIAQTVEQNNILIEQLNSKQEYIIDLIEALSEDLGEEEVDYEDDIYKTID